MESELSNRLTLVLTEEEPDPKQWFYLSFADESFHGAVIIKACGVAHAIIACSLLGINPGGEVMGVPIPDEQLPEDKWRNKLLSKENIQALWPDAKTIREHDEEFTSQSASQPKTEGL